ncbi:UNVERIFIED_CONTAM: hypothetical protein Slati_1765400 [Sesamum latifolium]|uniref:Integrase catalytic domain-containing protein n=1 Tax=Sesamum latifolium TaxID=2727402 RepID=A0AAW2WY66_9LAMI
MKDVYPVPDRHIRYAAIKAFFGTKMTEGSSVHSHGVKMLFLVKKLEDLKAGLNNDTYMDVILQSLPPSYDPFIVNYNMNGLEKSIHELINILVQYEERLRPPRRKARVPGAGRRRRARETVTTTASIGDAPLAALKEKGKGKLGVLSGRRQIMCACIAKERGIGRGSVHNSSPSQSNLIMTAQHKHKVDNHENAQIWHARLGHISKDRISRLVDSKNLEIDNLDHLPTCESCLKRKMTKKSFIRQSAIANGLLDLVHTDVCGPLRISARGGFSYVITFTDDHSRYGYAYLMRYKSEAFGRFKEYRLEVENQTNRKIKALQSDRGGEYLSGEFIDYLKENGILSQWTPPGTPQLNGVAERKNRTLLDMYPERHMRYGMASLRPTSLLVSERNCGYYFYDPAEQRIFISRNAVFLEKSFSSDNRCDDAEPHHDSTTSFEPTVHTDGVPVLRRSTRESRIPERYGFVGLTSQLYNDPKTYGEAMSDIDSDK